jgi:hypothetical protein
MIEVINIGRDSSFLGDDGTHAIRFASCCVAGDGGYKMSFLLDEAGDAERKGGQCNIQPRTRIMYAW